MNEMNNAHAYEMQVQMWKSNTWGVTISALACQNRGAAMADGPPAWAGYQEPPSVVQPPLRVLVWPRGAHRPACRTGASLGRPAWPCSADRSRTNVCRGIGDRLIVKTRAFGGLGARRVSGEIVRRGSV
jgi:hypothetical protein